MHPLLPLLLVVAAAGIAWRAWRPQPGEGGPADLELQPLDAAPLATGPDAAPLVASAEPAGLVDLGGFWRGLDATDNPMTWSLPVRGQQYAETIARAELANGIPAGLLGRLLQQESAYRPDIINGTTRSPAGAVGIAQFMPSTARDLGVDPTDPNQAIPAAGRYLASLKAQFGTWSQALAAYNWGQGNLRRLGIGQAPAETRAYVAQITNDVGVS